jgi:hypothetical protein
MSESPELQSRVTKYKNDRKSVPKDEIISSLIPEYVSECAMYLQVAPGEPCSSGEMIDAIAGSFGIPNSAPRDVIAAAKQKTGCETERCVLESIATGTAARGETSAAGAAPGRDGALRGVISGESAIGSALQAAAKAEIETRFKLVGPNGTELLSNFDIDGTLRQWTAKFRDFYPYNFNMRNYLEYSIEDGRVVRRPDSLATVSFEDLYARGYRCGACVINTDVYQGRGKHWMALFFDARGDREWSVEFFNSGGNGPGPEWINWLLKTRDQMLAVAKSLKVRARANALRPADARDVGNPAAIPEVKVIRSSSIRHQHSKTECGLYSVFYIYARLSGVPYGYFHSTPIPDQLMFELRQHLFYDEKRKSHPGVENFRFDFDKFANQIRIEWEETS